MIELDDGSAEVAREKGDRSLIGRICMERVIGMKVLVATMTKIWRISTLAEFQEVGNNTFFLTFGTHVDKLSLGWAPMVV